MIHNRHLSETLHRICNATIGFFAMATTSLWVNSLVPLRFQTMGLVLAFILTASATCALAVVNPNRFSIVEGIAGDAGYDELTENHTDKESTDDSGGKMPPPTSPVC